MPRTTRHVMSPVFFEEERREVFRGPQLTPAEYSATVVSASNNSPIESRQRQSEVPCRPSTSRIAFFLAPLGMYWAWPNIMGRERTPRVRNTPRGRLSTMDDRRNVNVPPRISYGSLVGESDGIAPYGLE